MSFACPHCPRRFNSAKALAGHISAHVRGLIPSGGSTTTAKGRETHRRNPSQPPSIRNIFEQIANDPRIIGDVATGIGKFLDALGLKAKPKIKAEELSPDAALERRIGRMVLDGVIRQATKQITRQLEPTIRAQAEVALVGSELEQVMTSEAKPVVAEGISETPVMREPLRIVDHVISAEDVEEAFS